jgi:hypothetical protein
MIGVAGEDLLSPVELLQEEAAHQEMRPGHRPERHDRVGAIDRGLPQTVRTADREG